MKKRERRKPPFGGRPDVGSDYLYLVDGGHIFATPWINTPETRKRSITILLTAEGAPFDLRFGGKIVKEQAVVTAPLVKRGVRCDNVQFMSFVVNPLCPQFQLLNTIPRPGLLSLPRRLFNRFNPAFAAACRGELSKEEVIDLQRGVIAATASCLPPPRPIDPRIEEVRALVQKNPNTRIKDLAAAVNLSESRLSHLFTAGMSMGIRSYAFWVKMHAALEMVELQNARFTEAAHKAGFEDLAHFSREYKRAFGISLSYFRKAKWVRVFEYRKVHFAEHVAQEILGWKPAVSGRLGAYKKKRPREAPGRVYLANRR